MYVVSYTTQIHMKEAMRISQIERIEFQRGKKLIPATWEKTVAEGLIVQPYDSGQHSTVFPIDENSVIKMQRKPGAAAALTLKAEFDLAATLKNPFVVPAWAMTTSIIGGDEHWGFLMPRMEPLNPYIMTRGEMCNSMLHAGFGLDYIHGRGVTHGDVSLPNILHDPFTKNFRLADFSTATKSKIGSDDHKAYCRADGTCLLATAAEMIGRSAYRIGQSDIGSKNIFELTDVFGGSRPMGRLLREHLQHHRDVAWARNASELSQRIVSAMQEELNTR